MTSDPMDCARAFWVQIVLPPRSRAMRESWPPQFLQDDMSREGIMLRF